MISIPSLKLVVNFIKDGKQVIAYSPALDISTVGKSEEHAKTRFQELVRIFFEDISERNVVDEVLKELGWKKVSISNGQPKWAPPQVTFTNVAVPINA